jgi:4-amino-4-deoxy-L-arabinose transferase-like glycosyltransferase
LAVESGLAEGKWELLGAKSGNLNRLPAICYYLKGGVIKLLNPSVSSIKFLAFLTDLGISLLLYSLMLSWFGQGLALATVWVYASLPIVIHFGMSGYQNIQSTFFLFLMLLFLTKGKKKKSRGESHFLTAGVAAGLGLYFYLSSIVNPLIGLLLIFFWFVNDYRYWLKVTWFFLVGLIVAAMPFIIFSLFDYNFIGGRAPVYSFWSKETDLLGKLGSQASRLILGFYPGPTNGAGMHYINLPAFPDFFFLFLFLLGLGEVIVGLRKSKPGFLELLLVLLVTLVFGGILTNNPPAPQRLLHLFPVIASLIVLGIWRLAQILGNLVAALRIEELSQLRPQSFLVIISLFMGTLAFYHFLKDNLPLYQNLPRSEYFFSQFYLKKGFREPVFIYIPVHKRDQIYYYSRGLISPISVDRYSLSEKTLNYRCGVGNWFLYLTESRGVNFLSPEQFLVQEKINWPNREGFFLFRACRR